MFGIFYLILCVLTGMEMAGCLFPQQITEKGNRIWVILPAAFGTGVLMLTWAVYVCLLYTSGKKIYGETGCNNDRREILCSAVLGGRTGSSDWAQ